MKIIPTLIDCGLTGFESPGAEYSKQELNLNDILITDSVSTFIGRASGVSMQGVGIYDGDLIIINRALKPEQGDVIVCVYAGNFVCKILDIRNKQLLSASQNHAPVNISEYEDFTIEGVVTSTIRIFKDYSVNWK